MKNLKCDMCRMFSPFPDSFNSRTKKICNECKEFGSKPISFLKLSIEEQNKLKEECKTKPVSIVAQQYNVIYSSLLRSFKKKEYPKKLYSGDNIYGILYSKISSFTRNEKRFTVKSLLNKIGNYPRCYITDKPINLLDSQSYSLDHIIPKSKGGLSTLENCNICLREVNASKSDMLIDEYISLCKTIADIYQ